MIIVFLDDPSLICHRLTGAGWGGCIVALVPEDLVGSYIAAVKTEYYVDYKKIPEEHLDTFIFSTQPGAGASIYKL